MRPLALPKVPDAEREWEIAVPALHPGQKAVLDARRRRNIVCAHRGWPKSTLLTRLAVEFLMAGYPVGWYAPTSNTLLDNWNQHWARVLTKKGLDACLHRTDQKITLPGVGVETCWFYSMEIPSNAAGPTYPVLLLDEGGSWPDGAFDSVIEPICVKALAAYGWYELWWVGTPSRDGNPYNDFWHALQQGLTGEDPETSAHLIPGPARVDPSGRLVYRESPLANPAYSFDMLANSFARTRRPERWRIEYLCEFLSDQGGQFEGVQGVCHLPCQAVDPKEGGVYQTGVDVGIRRDYSVISTIDMLTMEMVYYRRFRPGSWAFLEEAIAEVSRLYPGVVRVDCTGMGDRLPVTMAEKGVTITPVVWNVQNKAPALDHLAYLIDENAVAFWEDARIVFELQMMARVARKSGGWSIEAPKGVHDDIPMSLALACWNAQPVEKVRAAPLLLDALVETGRQAVIDSFFNDPYSFGPS